MQFDNDKSNLPKDINDIRSAVLPQEYSDEDIYKFTQSVRMRMAATLTREHVPVDPESGKLLLDILNDMDKQTLSRSRLKLDTEINKTDEEAKAVIAALLTNPQYRDQLQNKQPDTIEAEYEVVLPDDLPQFENVSGLRDVNPAQLEYDQIMDAESTPTQSE